MMRPGEGQLSFEEDFRDGNDKEIFSERGTAEILTEYRKHISTGTPLDAISQLGGLHRQLLQSSEFYAAGRVVLRKLSPREEAEKFGLNCTDLPVDLKMILLAMEDAGVDATTLKSYIKKSMDDPETLNWLAINYQEFVDLNATDALSQETKSLDNSPPPRDTYEVSEFHNASDFREASERRVARTKATIQELQQCYAIPQIEELLPLIGQEYREDKQLLNQWSKSRKEEDRAHYISSLRRQGCDFEMIRGKLWACFDREAETQVISVGRGLALRKDWYLHVDPITGTVLDEGLDHDQVIEVPEETKVIKSCIWELERSKAFCELNHTKAQWQKIYSYLWEKMGDAILLVARNAGKDREEKQRVRRLMWKYQNYIPDSKKREIVIQIAERGY